MLIVQLTWKIVGMYFHNFIKMSTSLSRKKIERKCQNTNLGGYLWFR